MTSTVYNADLAKDDMDQAPPDWETITTRQQALAPYYGLGFQKDVLEPDVYQKIWNHFATHARQFSCEGQTGVIETINSSSLPALIYDDSQFNAQLCALLQPIHEQWCGMPLVTANAYGIRVYQHGSYLHNHVDLIQSHVISSTICVDHRLNKPWPFYIEDIDGHGHEISLQPGEMIFYESARLKHGRPYPLDGEYYAALFVHYTPTTWSLTAADLQ